MRSLSKHVQASRLAWCIAWASLSGVCCAHARAQQAAAGDTLAGLRSAWTQTLEQHDLEGAIALYEPDAVFLSPEGGRFPDRAAIRTLYRSVFSAYRATITMTSQKQDCSAALCVNTGTYSEAITEIATGKKLAAAGSYVLVARREGDRSWKIAQLAWTGGGPSPVQ